VGVLCADTCVNLVEYGQAKVERGGVEKGVLVQGGEEGGQEPEDRSKVCVAGGIRRRNLSDNCVGVTRKREQFWVPARDGGGDRILWCWGPGPPISRRRCEPRRGFCVGLSCETEDLGDGNMGVLRTIC